MAIISNGDPRSILSIEGSSRSHYFHGSKDLRMYRWPHYNPKTKSGAYAVTDFSFTGSVNTGFRSGSSTLYTANEEFKPLYIQQNYSSYSRPRPHGRPITEYKWSFVITNKTGYPIKRVDCKIGGAWQGESGWIQPNGTCSWGRGYGTGIDYPSEFFYQDVEGNVYYVPIHRNPYAKLDIPTSFTVDTDNSYKLVNPNGVAVTAVISGPGEGTVSLNANGSTWVYYSSSGTVTVTYTAPDHMDSDTRTFYVSYSSGGGGGGTTY